MKKISTSSVDKIGTVASIMSVLMYVSYIPQIMSNLSGTKGNPIQPLVAFINCSIWTAYGLLKEEKDWPIVWANIPGIFLGLATFLTAIFNF
ncbi:MULTISPECIES: SemiSWEET family transporter [Lactobacillaceae]|uniref:SemiSWEET family transporter n=1 Tax=Lactobacillaceae TaxID=33958 RepID=UPI000C1B6C12|nr:MULTISPECIES: SemiSWEET family transporter [Lactobacillaceae]